MGNPWRCQTLRCHLLSLLREVLREGSVVSRPFLIAAPSSASRFSFLMCFCFCCVQNCFIQQIRVTSVYIRLLFLT